MNWLEASRQYRLALPREERRHPWLGPLLDALAIVDASVAEAAAASGRDLGCMRGCHGCCHQPIPVTPVEIMGLSLFCQEKMESAVLAGLVQQTEKETAGSPDSCRFLWHGACSVHPLRPIACRRYNVLGRACLPGEDATVARPGDVLAPSRQALQCALGLILPAEAGGAPVHTPDAFARAVEQSVLLSSVSKEIVSHARATGS